MEPRKYIAQVKIDDCATVRVLKITPNVIVKCDRDCACLEESKDGSIQCSIGWIKKMTNFQISALIIDYEVIMDRDADWEWPVCGADFSVIDEYGHIHKGEFLCDHILSPERIEHSSDTLFPGTRGTYRVYYETFPKGGKIVSIVAVRIGNLQGRMDLLTTEPLECDFEEERRPISMSPQAPAPAATPQQPLDDDLRERVEKLEYEMRKLRAEFDHLQRTLANNDSLPRDPFAPMRDPGISYHPLEKK